MSGLTPPSPRALAGLGAVRLDRRPHRALRAAHDGQRHVQVGRAGRAAGEDEGAQLLEPLEVVVAVGLELVDPLLP